MHRENILKERIEPITSLYLIYVPEDVMFFRLTGKNWKIVANLIRKRTQLSLLVANTFHLIRIPSTEVLCVKKVSKSNRNIMT